MYNSCKRARQGGGALGGWVPLTFDEREGKSSEKKHTSDAAAAADILGVFLIPRRFHVVQHLNRLSVNP